MLAFLVYLPGSKHLHIVTAAPNVWLAKAGPGGRLEPLRIDLEGPEEDLRFGADVATDLTRKQTLDLFSCTECGRCQDVCPAWATGKPLSPKLLIMGLRDHVVAGPPAGEVALQPLVPNAVTDEVVWDCVTCGACVRECPVDIEHVDTIVDLRRHLVMAESRFPNEAGALLRGVEGPGENPWNQPASARMDWAAGLDVRVLAPGDPAPEVLFWVGCAGAFDERAREATRSTVRLLQAAGIDVAVLGTRESCTGDPARRMGHEFLFQSLAERNVSTLNEAGVTTIVASCAHCFNTLANEYPDYGGTYEVVHHSELLARLVREGRLHPSRDSVAVTYHDACYLGRHNGNYDAPREVLGATTGDVEEMPRNRERSFCCGAGGARFWMEEGGDARINETRYAEAAATGADVVATACPFCLVMLDDASNAAGEGPEVADVATLLARSTLGGRRPPRPSSARHPGGAERRSLPLVGVRASARSERGMRARGNRHHRSRERRGRARGMGRSVRTVRHAGPVGHEPIDLAALADAAWWQARRDEALAARLEAYAGFDHMGDHRGAASAAIRMFFEHFYVGQGAEATGWLMRAQRHLADEPEDIEHGISRCAGHTWPWSAVTRARPSGSASRPSRSAGTGAAVT